MIKNILTLIPKLRVRIEGNNTGYVYFSKKGEIFEFEDKLTPLKSQNDISEIIICLSKKVFNKPTYLNQTEKESITKGLKFIVKSYRELKKANTKKEIKTIYMDFLKKTFPLLELLACKLPEEEVKISLHHNLDSELLYTLLQYAHKENTNGKFIINPHEKSSRYSYT